MIEAFSPIDPICESVMAAPDTAELVMVASTKYNSGGVATAGAPAFGK